MRLLIVAEKKGQYSLRRLREVAKERGHTLTQIQATNCMIRLGKKARLYHAGSHLKGKGLVIPRRGSGITDHDMAVLNQLDLLGMPALNQVDALAKARNKLRSLQVLVQNHIPIPRTVLCNDPRLVPEAVSELEGPPVIMKLLQGSQGKGVILVESVKQAEATLSAVSSLKENILLQEFIGSSSGKDYRLFVLDGEVIGAMRREAADPTEFRSNIHRGGVGVKVDPSEEMVDIALRATAAFGLDMAGIDLLESERGPLVLEVNTSPGFEGLEKATGLDIAGMVMDRAERLYSDHYGVAPL